VGDEGQAAAMVRRLGRAVEKQVVEVSEANNHEEE
jgi:hypothetical protein